MLALVVPLLLAIPTACSPDFGCPEPESAKMQMSMSVVSWNAQYGTVTATQYVGGLPVTWARGRNTVTIGDRAGVMALELKYVNGRVRVLINGLLVDYFDPKDPDNSSRRLLNSLNANPAWATFKKTAPAGWWRDLKDAFEVGASGPCNEATLMAMGAASTSLGLAFAGQFWAFPGAFAAYIKTLEIQQVNCGRP